MPTPGPSLKPGGHWKEWKGFSGSLSKATVSTAFSGDWRKGAEEVRGLQELRMPGLELSIPLSDLLPLWGFSLKPH